MKTTKGDSVKIDAVNLVREIRDQQYERTKDMASTEKRAYYQQQTQHLMAQLQDLIEVARQEMITT